MSAKNGKPCIKCGANEWAGRNCAPCARELAKQWRAANPEKKNEQHRRYRKAHPEKRKEHDRHYRDTNRDKVRDAVRQWEKANPDRVKENDRRWREANRDKASKKSIRWALANPGKIKAISNNRRTRKTQAGGSYTSYEWEALVAHQGGRCLACGKEAKLTADHVVPVAKGGTSDISNIQGLCQPCNSSKGTKIIDYRKESRFLRWIQKRLF
jgi:5-methylcytosine-specific restriction endonuclease McrA